MIFYFHKMKRSILIFGTVLFTVVVIILKAYLKPCSEILFFN